MAHQTLGVILVIIGAAGIIALGMGADPKVALERIHMHEGTQAEYDRARLLKIKDLRDIAWLFAALALLAGIVLLLTG